MPQDNQNLQQKPQQIELPEPSKSALDSVLLAIGNAKSFLLDCYHKLMNLEQTNLALGLKHMNDSAYLDAIIRFKIVGWLNPKNDIAQYLLGKAYVYAGKIDKAIEPLSKALKAQPELEEALFLLACRGKGAVPARVPPSLHIEQLEKAAATFQGKNAIIYSIGTNLLSEHFGNKIGFDVLDLDCRNGESGLNVFSIANHLVGVEPCLQLLAEARQQRSSDKLIYNELISKMPLDQLKEEERSFDIVQAYGSGKCYADLNEFFELAQKRVRADGVFLTSVNSKSGEGFEFVAKNRQFKHSSDYVHKTAKKQGLELISSQEIVNESGSSEAVFLFKKKS